MPIDPITGRQLPYPANGGITDPRTGQSLRDPAAPAPALTPGGPRDINAMGVPGGPPSDDGWAPATGWAATQGFNQSQLQNIFSNPFYLLRNVFQGIDESSPGYTALRDFGGDPLALFNIMQGAGRTVGESDQGANEFANFMANLYQQLGTAGGQRLSGTELLGNIFNEDVSGDTSSTLGRVLNAGDMNQQVRTLFNMLRDVASTTMNPLAAAGYQAAVARAGDRYGNEMLNNNAGDVPHILDWMRQNQPGLVVR